VIDTTSAVVLVFYKYFPTAAWSWISGAAAEPRSIRFASGSPLDIAVIDIIMYKQ
jgi:hypothetical protein